MKFSVYKLTNTINGKAYVGITKRAIRTRLLEHYKRAFVESSPTALHRAMRKYGRDAWAIEIVSRAATLAEINALEIAMIEAHGTFGKSGYNLTRGGDGTVGFAGSLHRQSKTYHVTFPDGQRETITGLQAFCVQHGLNLSDARRTTLYAGHSHKGFSFEDPSITRTAAAAAPGTRLSPETRVAIGADLEEGILTIDGIATKHRTTPFAVKNIASKIKRGEALTRAKGRSLYVVQKPDGSFQTINNLRAFCEEAGLSENTARWLVAHPGKSTRKGWAISPALTLSSV